MYEPQHARRQYYVDENGDHYEEELYTYDAEEDFPTDYEQEYWAEDDDTRHDCEESYYQRDTTTQWTDFDEVYAAYHDARKRFNDLKLARGFHPVVAMRSQGYGSKSIPTTATPGRGRSSGEGARQTER